MRPKALIDELDLLRPIYKATAAYGHFGRSEFSWEKTDRAAEMADDLLGKSKSKTNGSNGNDKHDKHDKKKKNKKSKSEASLDAN